MDVRDTLKQIFVDLDVWIESENVDRNDSGAQKLPKCQVTILGQMCLLVDEAVSAVLNLAQTGDLDAKLKMDFPVKKKLTELLAEHGLIYDEDSEKIFIPKGSKELPLFEFKNITVKRLDPESALVSKAVKAPGKNRQLLREAIDKNKFPNLMDRIEENNGDLGQLLDVENE
jgi:phage antirepressor YoqD-like protein